MLAKTNTIADPSKTSFLVVQVTLKASCFTPCKNLNTYHHDVSFFVTFKTEVMQSLCTIINVHYQP